MRSLPAEVVVRNVDLRPTPPPADDGILHDAVAASVIQTDQVFKRQSAKDVAARFLAQYQHQHR